MMVSWLLWIFIHEVCRINILLWRKYWNREYMECRLYVYMNNVSVEHTGSAKYTCDMVVNKIAGSIICINGQ